MLALICFQALPFRESLIFVKLPSISGKFANLSAALCFLFLHSPWAGLRLMINCARLKQDFANQVEDFV